MNVPQLIALWVHTLAFVIAWGWYGALGRFVLPAIRQSLEGPAQARLLVAVSRRALPFVLIAVGLFTVSGAFLLITDPRYAGLGNVVASTWTALMLIKHLFVVCLVGFGVAVYWLTEQVEDATTDLERTSAFHRLALSADGATAIGAVIALMTVAAQIAP